MRRCICGAALVCLVLPAAVVAHYPWFTADPAAPGGLIFVFEEGIAPGDGQYLDPFIKRGTFSLRSPDKKDPVPLTFKEIKKDGKRWLTSAPGVGVPRSLECYCKWGVYQGKLLHYYARHLDVATAGQLEALGRAERMKFDLVPRIDGDVLEVLVLWQGKPSPGKSLLIVGPKTRTTLTSDQQGVIRFAAAQAGLYRFRSQFIEPEPAGTEDGKDYTGLRQTATLTMTLPLAGSK